ncbi:hypothetical protein AB1K32_07630 [Metabacillus dongyingensis]|uniref:hypothetical protein n=1 Tax=Metabacillus dongyingensis TaxID=2874282 RepID=UPI003B8E2C49
MKVKVLKDFIDKLESENQNKEVLRAVGEEFTVSKARFDEIKSKGDFIKEVKVKSESKKFPIKINNKVGE